MNIAAKITRTGIGLAAAGKQVRFAAANAINRTLEEAEVDGRQRIRGVLTVRSAKSGRFLEQLVHFAKADRATREQLRGVMGIQDPFGKSFKGKSALLAKFEPGGTKTGFDGGPVAIPSSFIRPSFAQIVPLKLYPKNLGLAPRRAIEGGHTVRGARQTKGGKTLLAGKYRTFAIDWRFQGEGKTLYGVFQRIGRGPESETRLLWTYKRTIPIPARLQFRAGAERVIAARFAINFTGQLQAALRTAR